MNLPGTPDASPAHRPPGHAVPLDLRRTPDADAVRAALDTSQHDGERRFLVVDDAARLVAHQLLYEQLHSYGPARVVCLAVATPGERVLRRPLSLRPPAAGVLWVLDPHTAGDPDGLRPLLQLLAQPEVFDAVLHTLAGVVHGVAVPSVRVVEHDLSDEARTRAWKEALGALAGQETAGGGPGESVPPELAVLLDDSLPEAVAGHRWLEPSRPAAARRRACDDALDAARAGHRHTRGPAGMFGAGARRTDLPGRLAGLGDALEKYRDTVAGAFADADGVRLTQEQRARLLERGIVLPDLPAVSRTRVVPALRDLTEHLLDQPLPLRSAAARLAALSDRSAPSGSAARLARLDELCDPAYLRHLAAPPPFRAGGTPATAALLALVPAFVAGLWPGPGWFLGPATGAAGAALAALMWRHRPNRSPDGRHDGGGSTRVTARLLGGLAGGVIGAVAGSTLPSPPSWAGAAAAALALVAAVVLAVRDWTRSVDAWWRATDAEYAERVVGDVDRLLAETAVHDWLLADARRHCADGARAAALLLRSLAATADGYGEGDGPAVPAPAPRGAGAEPAPRQAPPAEAEGGAELWEWDTWSDSSAADGWYDAAPSGPSGHPGPAGFGAPADAPYGPHDDRDGGFGDPYAPDGGPYGTTGPDAPYDVPAPPYGSAGHPYGSADPGDPSGPRHIGPAYEAVPDPSRDPFDAFDEDWPPLGAVEDPPWLERERGDGGPDLVDTLVADLASGTRRLLAPCWARIERDPARAGRTPLDGPMRDLLDEVRGRLLRDAATSPPPHDPHSGRRPDATRMTGVAPDRVTELLAPGGDAESTVPLCGPQHRRLLSADPLAVRRVRFAPEAFRRGAAEPDGPHRPDRPYAVRAEYADDVVWTPTGRHAGVLGLVPLRGDAVRMVREATPGEEGEPA
ncbi:hypothetical protein [Streptomyces roseolilacinus]|uniref:Uncharacterized protein n=1 Tax=Streptomyces roseolilacinus TaxID=66904 RepID=A0A918EIU5_9ACTN|nr:hypothetical protein [Streptomyces roseolilacinus]GGQ00109.1 hypothetical protein GCM10010249_17920 [Streptomyces roseolilacinus]